MEVEGPYSTAYTVLYMGYIKPSMLQQVFISLDFQLYFLFLKEQVYSSHNPVSFWFFLYLFPSLSRQNFFHFVPIGTRSSRTLCPAAPWKKPKTPKMRRRENFMAESFAL